MPDTESGFPPLVLTFAASDPSGGAGMQADLLTLASMGCHPLSVITAITVQDSLGVEGVLAIDADWVADQARCLLEDMPVDAFKIGVMGSVENIAAIAEIVSDYPDVPLILDPVLASGRGDELANDEMTHALRELLLPQTTILTPNSLEVRRLAESEDEEDRPLDACAARLIEAGCEYVLVTGTHENTQQVNNTLYGKSGVVRTDSWPRLPGTLSRFRLHARVGDRRDARERPRPARSGARGAGIHVADAARRPTARAWDSSCPTGSSGRARNPTRPATRRKPRAWPMSAAATERAAGAVARKARLCGLYAVTPDEPDTARLLALVEAAMAGGANAIQYRNKAAVPQVRHAQAAQLARLCQGRGVLLIVNDDPRLARDVDAAGVHLGEDDGNLGCRARDRR